MPIHALHKNPIEVIDLPGKTDYPKSRPIKPLLPENRHEIIEVGKKIPFNIRIIIIPRGMRRVADSSIKMEKNTINMCVELEKWKTIQDSFQLRMKESVKESGSDKVLQIRATYQPSPLAAFVVLHRLFEIAQLGDIALFPEQSVHDFPGIDSNIIKLFNHIIYDKLPKVTVNTWLGRNLPAQKSQLCADLFARYALGHRKNHCLPKKGYEVDLDLLDTQINTCMEAFEDYVRNKFGGGPLLEI